MANSGSSLSLMILLPSLWRGRGDNDRGDDCTRRSDAADDVGRRRRPSLLLLPRTGVNTIVNAACTTENIKE